LWLFIASVGVGVIFFGIDDLSSIIFDRSSSDEAAFGRRSIADNSGKQKSGLCTKFKRYCTDKYLYILVLRRKRTYSVYLSHYLFLHR